jgi:hypothetical protein
MLVATDGHLGRAASIRLGGPQALVRTLTSGRELVSPLLAQPTGWIARLRNWLSG